MRTIFSKVLKIPPSVDGLGEWDRPPPPPPSLNNSGQIGLHTDIDVLNTKYNKPFTLKKNKNVQSLKRKDTLGNISKMNTKGCVVVVFNHGTTNNTERALDRRIRRA